MTKITTILLLFFASFSHAQWTEYGVLVGGSNYQGDLSPDEFQEYLRESSLAFGGFYRLNFNRFLTVKTSLLYAKIKGADAHLDNTELNRRNLSFKSNIFELGVTAEFNILGFNPNGFEKMISPYIFGGVSAFYFNPKALYNGNWVALQPLGTEGQGAPGRRKKYSRVSIAFPLGFGLKWAVNDQINIGFEAGSRITLTDYLDDVAYTYMNYNELLAANGPVAAALGDRSGELLGGEPTIRPTGSGRGNAELRDYYFIGGVTLSYTLNKWPFGGKYWKGKKGERGSLGCPTF